MEQEFVHVIESSPSHLLCPALLPHSCSDDGCEGPNQLPVLIFCAAAQGSWALFSVVTWGPQQAWEPGLEPWLLVRSTLPAKRSWYQMIYPTYEGIKNMVVSTPWPSLLLSTQWDTAEAKRWPLLQARQLAVSGELALGLGATSWDCIVKATIFANNNVWLPTSPYPAL